MHEIMVIVAVGLILSLAAIQDIRCRTVSDANSIAICVMAAVLPFLTTDTTTAILLSFGCSCIALFMFTIEGKIGYVVLSTGVAMFMAASIITGDENHSLSSIICVLILLLYNFGLIKGGADAKILMSLSMLFPSYDHMLNCVWVPTYPAGYIFNPIFSILFISVILSSFSVIYIMNRGRKEGCLSIGSFPMKVSIAKEAFVWPIKDGNIDYSDHAYEGLNEDQRVMVTPMIPFVLPIAIAFIIVSVMGSPLFAII